MSDLQTYIKSYFGIPDQHLNLIESLFHLELMKADEYFCKKDQYGAKLSFIKSGYLRIYDYVDGKEVTQWISSPGDFVTDISSLVFNAKCKKNIQALEDCEIFSISKENYNRLPEILPKWEKLEKLFMAKCFMTLEDRIFAFLSLTAEQRYLQMFTYNPTLFNKVPLQYIASMLGMTPETLSRVRKKISS